MLVVNKNVLKPNSFSSSLYDNFSLLNQNDKELFIDINNSGEVLIPLVVTTDYVVISGVRRLAIINNIRQITEVPIIMTDLHSDDLNESIIMRYNLSLIHI